METGTREKVKELPPPKLEAAATLFMPRSLRDDLIGDLAVEFQSNWQYACSTVGILTRVIPGQVSRAFKPGLVLAEMVAACIGFAGVPLSAGLICGLAVVLGTLTFRDGHTFNKSEPGDPALDVLMALGLGTICLIAAAIVLPEATMSLLALIHGFAVALPALLTLRMIFRPEGSSEPADQAYRTTVALTLLWLMAWYAFTFANRGAIFRLDLIVVAAQIMIVTMDFRLRQGQMSRVPKSGSPISLSTNPKREDMVRKRGNLWVPKSYGSEIMFFSVVASQLGVAIVQSPSALQIVTNVLGFAALLALWKPIRAAHQATALQLQQAIDLMDAEAAAKSS